MTNSYTRITEQERLRRRHRRLLKKFTVSDDCWVWHAANNYRYGLHWANGQHNKAHRYIYEMLIGPVPNGLELDHLCGNKLCVRPDHLEPVTHAENMARWASRRREESA